MTFDLDKILESKRAMRSALAARPISEKLEMLDALRERTLTLRKAKGAPANSIPNKLDAPNTPTSTS